MNPLSASLILGLLWGLWHLPLFLTFGHALAETFFDWFLLGIVAEAILYTWLSNNTRGSLLLPLLLRAATPTAALFLAASGTNPAVGTA